MTDRVSIIMAAVAGECGLVAKDMAERTHRRDIAWPRQIAMKLARELTDLSLPSLGARFGGMHHTTIMWGINAVDKRIEADKEFRELFNCCSAKAKLFLTSDAAMSEINMQIAELTEALATLERLRDDMRRAIAFRRIGGARATASGRAAA